MQGRLIPDSQKSLQNFLKKSWVGEINQAKTLGYDYIQLLYDVDQEKNNPLCNQDLTSKLINEINNKIISNLIK